MANLPKGTREISIDALKDALRDLDAIRIFSSPSEASRVAELKREIRSRIARNEGAPEAETANIDMAGDMDRTSALAKAKHVFETNMRLFIRLEVETGTVFAAAALDSNDVSRERGCTAKARKAYDTALHFIGRAEGDFLSGPISPKVKKKLLKLKNTLTKLGEQFAT